MRRILPLFLTLFASVTFAQTAPTVTLTATPTSGLSPLNVTLNWSSTNATSCTASGGWTGVKATSGSQAVTGLTANTTFTLTCSAGAGTARVSWTAPTTNTDGSALTNLAGFKLYWASSSTGVPTATAVVLNSPTTLTYNVTGLTAGTWYFGVKAYNSANVDSDMSNLANRTITVASATASATVTVGTKPNPPVIVTVDQIAYDVRYRWFRPVLGKAVGTIPLGVACEEKVIDKKGTDFYGVPPDQVTFTGVPRSEVIVAKCAASS